MHIKKISKISISILVIGMLHSTCAYSMYCCCIKEILQSLRNKKQKKQAATQKQTESQPLLANKYDFELPFANKIKRERERIKKEEREKERRERERLAKERREKLEQKLQQLEQNMRQTRQRVKTHILAIGDNRNILIYKINKKEKRKKLIKKLQGHEGTIWAIAFSPDGKWLASGSKDTIIKIWDTKSWKEVAQHTHKDTVFQIKFHPTLPLMGSTSKDRTIIIWDISDNNPKKWKPFQNYKRDYKVKSFAFAPLTKVFASGTANGNITVQKFAKNGTRHAYTGNTNAPHHLRDLKSLHPNKDIKFLQKKGGGIFATLFHPHDSTKLVFTSGKKIELWSALWNTLSWKKIRTVAEYNSTIFGLTFDPKGSFLAASATDSTIAIFNTQNWKEARYLHGHKNTVLRLAFSNDNALFASSSRDRSVKIWNPRTWTEIISINRETPFVCPLAFKPEKIFENKELKDKRDREQFTQKNIKKTLKIHMPNSNALEGYHSLTGPEISRGEKREREREERLRIKKRV